MRGENSECMRNELRQVHSFIRTHSKDLLADIGIDAAFEYIKELIFAIMYMCRRFVPGLGKVVRQTEGSVCLSTVH